MTKQSPPEEELLRREAGHDVVWAADWPTVPGDKEILRRAHQEARVLVTLDKDFGELAIVLAKYGPEPEAGAIVTAGPAASAFAPHRRVR